MNFNNSFVSFISKFNLHEPRDYCICYFHSTNVGRPYFYFVKFNVSFKFNLKYFIHDPRSYHLISD